MQYIGSLYASDISSSDLRELALSQLDDPNLPPNGFTVQALLLMAIAMFCDDAFDQGRAILDRAIYMALEMRMNSRTFANMERDPVLAESWRRTYWGLYLADSQLARFREASTFLCVPSPTCDSAELTKSQTFLHRSKRRIAMRRVRLRWCK
jgi:hypothetical protein